jgi:ABC-type multidrug transport system ATPase subunit
LARLVAGYTHPTTGTVSFEGHNIHAEYASLRSRIGMVPQDDVVHGQLTVNQALMYAAELRLPPDTTKADRAQVVAQVLEELEMTRHADTRVDKLSGGQRKRASVALELLTGPSLLILDEPTSGLDPAITEEVLQALVAHVAGEEMTVFFSSHQISEVDQIADHVAIVDRGRVAVAGELDDLRQRYCRVQAVFEHDAPDATFRASGAGRVQRAGRVLTVLATEGSDGVVQEARGLNPLSVDVVPVTLKEIFLETVAGEN